MHDCYILYEVALFGNGQEVKKAALDKHEKTDVTVD